MRQKLILKGRYKDQDFATLSYKRDTVSIDEIISDEFHINFNILISSAGLGLDSGDFFLFSIRCENISWLHRLSRNYWEEFSNESKRAAYQNTPIAELLIGDQSTSGIYKYPGFDERRNYLIGCYDTIFFLSSKCSIPDDHIAPRRSALFMARSVLEAARDGESDAYQAA